MSTSAFVIIDAVSRSIRIRMALDSSPVFRFGATIMCLSFHFLVVLVTFCQLPGCHGDRAGDGRSKRLETNGESTPTEDEEVDGNPPG
jgi:hypothetical protein